ncbi:MAG: histidine triad nucleotide-binding protein [Deltaproteobacteria bacterium]|nr:histidine triad nucleotide-binding protein [Deltaproteobacteria bacterium]
MACIFCQIVAGEVGSTTYQDEQVVAFRDINPQAPVHLLIVSRKHIESLAELIDADVALAGHMVVIANELAKQEGISESGYRLVVNCGREGGQVVSHLHFHLLGGRRLTSEMG